MILSGIRNDCGIIQQGHDAVYDRSRSGSGPSERAAKRQRKEARGSPRDDRSMNLFIDVLSAIAEEFPSGGLDKDYLVLCDLPCSRCGHLIGKGGKHMNFVQRVTR